MNFTNFKGPKTGVNIGFWLDDCNRTCRGISDCTGIHIANGASNATASSDVLELETSGERTQILITDNCGSYKVSTTSNQAKPLGLVLMSLILILHVESCCRSYIHGLDYILATVNIRNATIMSSQNMNVRKVLPSRLQW